MNSKTKFNNLSESIYKFIVEYRNYSKWYFYDNEITSLDKVKQILNDEDERLEFMTELSEMFEHFAMHKNFNIPEEEKFYDDLCLIFKNYNNCINEYEDCLDINSIANDLIDYAKDTSPYEYRDCYDTDEDAYNQSIKDLSTKSGTASIIEWLCNEISCYATESDLTDKETLNDYDRATKLLKNLCIYSKTFDKEDLEI